MRVSADWIWTGVGEPEPGMLELDGERVVEFRPGAKSPDRHYASCVILPGLVNSHVHLDLTFASSTERLTGSFPDWLLSIRDLRKDQGEAGLRAAAQRGIEQSLEAGTTTLVDYDPSGLSLEPLAASPIRRAVLREVIRFRRPSPELEQALREFLDGATSPLEVRGLAPHAPYTVHSDVLAVVARMCQEHRTLLSSHVAEQPFEREFLADGTGPYQDFFEHVGVDLTEFPLPKCSGLAWLDQGEALGNGTLAVHANFVDRDDIALLAKQDATVVYCPQSHEWFGHSPYPLLELLEAGVRVVVGTDGLVSNRNLSILDELRAIAKHHPSISPTRLFHFATRDAHQALGNRLGTGTLTPDSPADFVVVPYEALGGSDPLTALLNSQVSPSATYIAGQLVAGRQP